MLRVRISRLAPILRYNLRRCSSLYNVANSLYQKACNGELCDAEEIGAYVDNIRANTDAYSPLDMSKALYGLMNMKGDTPHELDLVDALRHKLDDTAGLEGRHLCMSLFGLQSLRIRSGPTADLVGSLGTHLSKFQGSVELSSMLMAFRGVAGMDGRRSEVRQLIEPLCDLLRTHMKAEEYVLNKSDVFDMMGALRGKESGYKEVKELVYLFAQILRQMDLTSQPMTPEECKLLLSTIKSMGRLSSSDKEVTLFLRGINSSLQSYNPHAATHSSEVGLTIDDVLAAVQGLGRMSSSDEEVRTLCTKLSSCLDDAQPVLPQEVATISGVDGKEGDSADTAVKNGDKYGNALYGLRNMKSSSREARNLLMSILNAMKRENDAILAAAGGTTDSQSTSLVSQGEQTAPGNKDGERARRLLPSIHMSLSASAKGISGLRNMGSERREVRDAALILGHMLRERGRKLSGRLGKGDVRSAWQEIISDEQLYLIGRGIHGMSTDFVECRSVLGALRGRLDTRVSYLVATKQIEETRLSAHSLCTLLNGLEKSSHEHQVVDRLIKIIYYEIKRPPPVYLNPLLLSSALRGLKRMDDGSHNVERLVDALVVSHYEGIDPVSPEEVKGKAKWEPAYVCHALSGLQLMKAGCREVRKLLELIADRMGRIRRLQDNLVARTLIDSFPRTLPFAPYSPVLIADAMLGMRNMSSHYYVVSDIVTKLAQEADMCADDRNWSEHELAKIMVGMCNMNSDDKAVQLMLKVITKKLRAMPKRGGKFTTSNSVDMIYALKTMGSESKDVVTYLVNLLPRMSLDNIKSYQLSKIFTGLRGMSNVHIAPYLVDPPTSIEFNTAKKQTRAEIESEGDSWSPSQSDFEADADDCPSHYVSEPTQIQTAKVLEWKEGYSVVEKLLRRLAAGVHSCQGNLSVTEFATIMRGLQFLESGPVSTNSYSEPAVQVAEALVRKMTEEIDDALDVSMCCRALYGLLGYASGSSAQVDMLRQSLLSKVMFLARRAGKNSPDDEKVSHDIFRPIEQTVNFHLISKPGHFSPTVTMLLEDMNSELVGWRIDHMARRAAAAAGEAVARGAGVANSNDTKKKGKARPFEERRSHEGDWVMDAEDTRQSTIEMKFAEHFRWFIKNHYMPTSAAVDGPSTGRKNQLPVRVTFSHNEVLMGCHTDFVLRVYEQRESAHATEDNDENSLIMIYNVEIDGPLHRRATNRHFAANRDKVLESSLARRQLKVPVIVRRIDVSPTDRRGVPLLSYSSRREKVMLAEVKHFDALVKAMLSDWKVEQQEAPG